MGAKLRTGFGIVVGVRAGFGLVRGRFKVNARVRVRERELGLILRSG